MYLSRKIKNWGKVMHLYVQPHLQFDVIHGWPLTQPTDNLKKMMMMVIFRNELCALWTQSFRQEYRSTGDEPTSLTEISKIPFWNIRG